ncbi:LysR family transcriptional regulator [Cardiobacteriaceae bacterium TAE3-ERU3]|nr:LysR family transcriptional regulator [Cardiobacteriaceae bacterium TAE3-ERU3]
MNIKIQQLQYFLAVVECGGFRAAAAQVNRSQAALSSALKTLEETLGTALFEHGYKMKLTPFGEALHPKAVQMVRTYDIFVDEARAIASGEVGELRLASVPSVAARLIPDVLKLFTQQYPQVRVCMSDDNAAGITARLVRGEVDLALGNPSYIDLAEIDFTPLVADPLGLVCHRDNPLAEQSSVSWQVLLDYPFIRNGTGILLDGTAAQAVNTDAHYAIDNITALFSVLALNIGVTTLPRLAFFSVNSPDLRWIPFNDLDLCREIGIFKLKQRTLTPPAQAFYELCCEHLNKDYVAYVRNPV